MGRGHLDAAFRQVGRLFSQGSVSGFTEAQLLTRFLQAKDEAAFEGLVQRFGPMVLGVCRQSLAEPHAVEDAFQATFLVLVRRGHTIRDPALLGNWLYGVAVKVAKRARADSHKRTAREGGCEVMADLVGNSSETSDPDFGPLLHEELARLPEKYRAPIVLCFLEGRTHEEAATLLRWPIGTVKGRVARAKDLLRERLTRRGVTASTAVLALTLSQTARASLPPVLLDQTVKAAMVLAAGGTVAAGLSSAGAYALSEGVSTAMAMTKMKLAVVGALALAISATGASVYATLGESNLPQDPLTETPRTGIPPADLILDQVPNRGDNQDALGKLLGNEPAVGPLPPFKDLAQKRILAAKQRLDASAAYYENGTLTIDRYIEAAHRLMIARMEGATDPTERNAAAEDNVRLMRVILKREEEKYKVGVGALPNVAEAAANLADAEMELYKLRHGEDQVAASISRKPQVEEDAEDKAQNDRIREFLNKPLSFPFSMETPLEDVIKYLQQASMGPGMETGIPIYVDPQGLQETEVTMSSPIMLNLEGVKARTGLRLILKQLGLGYFVREGLLSISPLESEEYMDATDPDWREREAKAIEKAKANGGGGGGFR